MPFPPPLLLLLLLLALSSSLAKRLGGTDSSFLVLQPDGQVFGTGMNTNGQLGTGVINVYPEYYPVPMLGVRNATDVCAAKYHACIVDRTKEEGEGYEARCVGSNTNHLLGDGTGKQHTTTLVSVSGLTSASAALVEVVCGERSSCALLTNGGAVKCWGGNQFGALGDGTTQTASTPRAMRGFELAGAKQVAMGGRHTCVLTLLGKILCTGYNWYGQVGDGTIVSRTVPTQVTGGNAKANIKAINALVFASVACGASHTCAGTVQGTVYCWGLNTQGQLGVNSLADSLIPRQVSKLPSGAASVWIAAGSSFAVLKDGSILAWGSNDHAQLGNGNTDKQITPVEFASWTEEEEEQEEGEESEGVVLPPGGVTDVVEVRGGASTTCVLFPNGAVKCLGNNEHGGMGVGPSVASSLRLLDMEGLHPVLPTRPPTPRPSLPTRRPTSAPSPKPSKAPSPKATRRPTLAPSPRPTKPQATRKPTKPTKAPSPKPTNKPTKEPSRKPTKATKRPSPRPTKPTKRQTTTAAPSLGPTTSPSAAPTQSPTVEFTLDPAEEEEEEDTAGPTTSPTVGPSTSPTASPTLSPADSSFFTPTASPSASPTASPTASPLQLAQEDAEEEPL